MARRSFSIIQKIPTNGQPNCWLHVKNRRKLWIAFALIVMAGMSGRFAWIYIHEPAGVVLIIFSAICVVAASVVFAIYFRE
jgi:hypothetical protein